MFDGEKSALFIYLGCSAANFQIHIRELFGYGSVLTKRPDDGSVEPKHVVMNVFLTINWMCLTEKICTLYNAVTEFM